MLVCIFELLNEALNNDLLEVDFSMDILRRLEAISTTNGTIVRSTATYINKYKMQVKVPNVPTGTMKMEISVGGNPMGGTFQPEVVFTCEAGQYVDMASRFCRPCPKGATCSGHEEQPVAKRGYWWQDPLNIRCEPRFACLGNNTCAEGYNKTRCLECSDQFHRLNGECVSCPEQPWLPVALLLVAIITVVLISYFLTRKGVSLGLLSIGVDYFQVLSMFGSARVAWPPAVLNAFSMISAFNLNLEIIAPECWNIQVTYAQKWFLVQAIPIALAGLFVTIFAAAYFQKRVIKRRTTRLTSHLPKLIGSCLVMMYYLYLYETRTIFDVFNCTPTDPDDGNSYIGAGLIPCFEENGIHMMLLPWAVVAFIVYCVGYPAFVGYTLSKNRRLVMEDQLLRAMDRGLNRQTNPNCWDFRKKFSRLYYQVFSVLREVSNSF